MREDEYVINSRPFANSIKFLIGVDFKEIPHNNREGKNVFVFENTPLLQDTIAGLMELRKKLNNK